MKRDKHLMRLILLQVRDGVASKELSEYSEEETLFHGVLLVNDGYVRGDVLADKDGTAVGVALLDVTSTGHDFLENVDSSPIAQQTSPDAPLAIFISHSSRDADVAEALVLLLRIALTLNEKEIRCTSTEGSRLPVGADTNERLKKETTFSRSFIGLITPESIKSTYVLFELGARWGSGRTISPLCARGADSSFLKGPISHINALDGRVPDQVHQFLHDLAQQLDRQVAIPSAYTKQLNQFVEIASSNLKEATPDTLSSAISKLIFPVPKVIRDDIMRFAARSSSFHVRDFCVAVSMSHVRAQYYLDEMVKAEFLHEARDAMEAPIYILTHSGRRYIIDNDLDRK